MKILKLHIRGFRAFNEEQVVEFPSPHVLRHTFCTLLSSSGVSDRLAMSAMGHSDLRMLQRYQHVFPGEVAREIQRLRLDI